MVQPEWKNWSGSLRFTPGQQVCPKSESELVELVKKAAQEGNKIRMMGAGHSSTFLVQTNETLLLLRNLQGLVSYDTEKTKPLLKPECW